MGGTAEVLVRADTLLGAREAPGICDFGPASLLRLYKIAHSEIDGGLPALIVEVVLLVVCLGGVRDGVNRVPTGINRQR